MNRDDAVRKVAALMRLHRDERGNPDERQRASEQATKLRLKYGISDHALELELAADDTSDSEFFGHRLFFFGRHVAPHVEAIRAEIAAALAKADQLDPMNRAETYSRLYRDLRNITEGSTWVSGLKSKRDAAVKAYYQQVAYEYGVNHADRDRGLHYERMQHQWARDRTASACDLRKDAVERIVGVHERTFYEREAAEMAARVCEACGLDGNEDRQWCSAYDDEDGQQGRWLHPACKEQESTAPVESSDVAS